MKLPVIINIDSKYDWTKEVQNIWVTIDCKKLHQRFPTISEADFDFRLNKKLVIIGLCSPSFIDRFYFRQDNCYETARDNDSEICREEQNWRASQVGEERNVRHFNGEEPHFRHPKTCDNYVIEPYGIYSDDCSKFLSGVVDKDKLPLGAKGGAGIFLCPERIVRIYPTLLEVLSNPKYPLPLADNPILSNLKMVLLHELGHHIFPVHRNCKGKKYISEGLANYFCYSNLTEIEQAWLLYKSSTLQPPEYSTYRFIELLKRYYKTDINTVLKFAFKGDINSWESIFDREFEYDEEYKIIYEKTFKEKWPTNPDKGYKRNWKDIIERQSELTTMFISLDALPANGLLNELHNLGGYNREYSYCFDGILYMRNNRLIKLVHPDFIWDLYNDNSILPWVFSNEIPDEIWSSWGMSTSHDKMGTDSKLPGKLSWPEGPLFRMTTRQDWERIVKESPYQWARNAAMVWLLDDLKNKSDIDNFLTVFTLSDNPPTNCGAVIEAFDQYSSDFNPVVKGNIISIFQGFIEGMENNRCLRLDVEKLIDKLKMNKE